MAIHNACALSTEGKQKVIIPVPTISIDIL
jgi:hypothetical protein